MAEKILSVGIDIGTSTTSLVFSNLTIEKVTGDMYMPKTEITDKKVIYRSPIYFTPLKSNTELDTQQIRQIIEEEYRKAGVKADDVETGAVIITGDTARKVNAEKVLSEISRFAGDFVVATAGPDLESILAGKGSGAEQYSIDTIDTICNMDIGGGTTNTATFYDGKCIDADCLDTGGRLIRFEENTTKIAYAFPKISEVAEKQGITAKIGSVLKPEEIQKITDVMAEAVIEKLALSGSTQNFLFFQTEKKQFVPLSRKVDAVSFSGGVGKLIYEEEKKDKLAYNDIGIYLAESVKKAVKKYEVQLVKPKETISATVIGAGNHSVDISGGTITITQIRNLPLKNIPILTIDDALYLSAEEFKSQVEKKVQWMQGLDKNQNIALNLQINEKLGFNQITGLAEKVIYAAKELLKVQDTLIVIVFGDYGKVLGQSISVRLPQGKEVICIDAIDVGKGDYIDIGRPVGVADSVPVVIKTIAFNY